MRVRPLLVSCALLLSSAALSAAPAKKKPAEDYWPMAVGNTWTIDAVYNGQTNPQVLTVVKRTPVAGRMTEASIDYAVGGAVTQTEVYRYGAKGLFRVHTGKGAAGTIEPPLPVIRYPVVIGSSWTWKGTFTSGDQSAQASATLSANGPESVITSTGDFQALRIHLELLIGAEGTQRSLVTNDYWFAPAVGMIQQAFKQGSTEIRGTLSSYSLK